MRIFKRLFGNKYDIYYLVEKVNWSIREDGNNIVSRIKGKKAIVVDNIKHIPSESYIHFGSFNTFFDNIKFCKRRKGYKVIVTCFHIVDGDPRADKIADYDRYVEKWHTSCEITKNKLIRYGVPQEKIYVIPLGIDLKKYFPNHNIRNRDIERQKIGIKKEQLVIGSFQKDGNGWKEGLSPKLIKGPDVFCNMVERLAKRYDIFVVLSGPARGYVKRRLDEARVPYYHVYYENADEVAKLYKLLDIYAVTSREEGGPKAILESMASGIPIITTKVGMALDIVRNNENGILVDVGDEEALVNAVCNIAEDERFKNKLVQNGLLTVQQYSLESVVQKYQNNLYQ